MKRINNFLFLLLSISLCGGCASGDIKFDDVASGFGAAVTGLAAHELAPDDWNSGEKAALAAATAATAYVVGKSLAGRSKREQQEAYEEGFKSGKALGARRQLAIVQAMQRNVAYSSRSIYAIPAPMTPGIKKVPYNVYLEVSE